jgi:glucose/arabinose dehydrogenase
MVQNSREGRTRRRLTRAGLILALLLGLGLSGCQAIRSVMDLFQTTVEATLAPTTVPLPTAQPTDEPETPAPTATVSPETTATSEAPASPTEPPAAATEAPATATDVAAATRVVPPQETINLPPGFGISVFYAGLSDSRMMTLGPDGALYVAERGAGRIVRLPDRDGDGVADGVEIAADGLRSPSSLDFATDGSLYVGETTRILRLSDPDRDGVFQEREVVIDGLPSGGHSTRTVLVSPDGAYLYVSVGSSCNVCIEEDERRSTIMRYNPDGSGSEVYAEGLRNAVGITFRPGTNELWATNNGRDWLGDDQPPETIYIVQQGDDAGWPRCHAARIVDPEYGEAGACEGVAEPEVEMQAHTAPLGLGFYTGEQFPEAYRGDLFVALHGSWNRSVPVGYKVVRIPIENGQAGGVQDFAVGWLRENGSNWGRPVDVVTGADGSLFVSDDAGGVIYRIFYSED